MRPVDLAHVRLRREFRQRPAQVLLIGDFFARGRQELRAGERLRQGLDRRERAGPDQGRKKNGNLTRVAGSSTQSLGRTHCPPRIPPSVLRYLCRFPVCPRSATPISEVFHATKTSQD